MARLSVNINKLATLRNARGGDNPNVIEWAKRIQDMGAEGITVHPRPDERHITRADARGLKEHVSTEYNIEGYPSADFIQMVIEIAPEQVTLVPDPPGVLTSNAGWDAIAHKPMLSDIIGQFKAAGIRTSIFMETDKAQISAAADCGADRIELYTEAYAKGYHTDAEAAVRPYADAAKHAVSIGLGVNAGHDLDLLNLKYFLSAVPEVEEVSIGHALVCDALHYGMANTIGLYLREADATES